MSYLLIHRSPSGQIAAHITAFDTVEEAARFAVLYTPGPHAAAAKYAADLAAQLPGSVVEHPSGYAFRVLEAHVTADGVPVTPGLRVRVNGMWWGKVYPDQFMSTGLIEPGSSFFDGWYLVCKEGETQPYNKYNGERMSTKELDA